MSTISTCRVNWSGIGARTAREYFVRHILILIAFGVVCVAVAEAQTATYWKARVRAALAISETSAKSPVTPAKPVLDKRPTVRVYTTANCPACDCVKDDAAAGAFPFRLIVCKASEAPEGFVLDCFPTFHWNDASGRGRRWPPTPLGDHDAYPGCSQLTEIWQATQVTK